MSGTTQESCDKTKYKNACPEGNMYFDTRKATILAPEDSFFWAQQVRG